MPDRASWNEVVAANQGSPLHSWEWATAKEQSGQKVLWFYRNGPLLKVAVPFYVKKFRSAWLPDGLPFSGDPAALKLELASFLRQNGINLVLTRYMDYMCSGPVMQKLFPWRWGKSSHTFLLDLKDKSEEGLLAGANDTTRKHIRRARREGYLPLPMEADDYRSLWLNHEKFTREKQFRSAFSEHFYYGLIEAAAEPQSGLQLLAKKIVKDGAAMGFMVSLQMGSRVLELIRYDHDDFKSSTFGPKLLSWEVISLARNNGVALYDFGGVDPAKQPGLYQFKKGFGGQLIGSSPLRVMINL